MKGFAVILLLSFLAAPVNLSFAQSKSDFKDSLDFLADDGIMTPEEMEEEAIGVHNRCAADINHNTYFDCECIGGAFLEEREAVGPYVEQYTLLQDVYLKRPECVNDVSIAGMSYTDCQAFAGISRRMEKNNEEFCTCVAQETVKQFQLTPSLRSYALQNIRTRANVACMQQFPPENRGY